MKKLVLLSGAVAFLFVGCASDRNHYSRYHNHTDHYGDRTVVVEPGDRVYVREYDNRYGHERYRNEFDNAYRYRGKHPDALGWNDPYWTR
jgi:hypothetical protein